MIDRRELITVCRQVGGMMEAGIDILRITRVLRAQTENPRLLALYDALDHDLRMGEGVADAMAHAEDVFTPFDVSLVRQGEARNDLAGAFLKLADYIHKEITASESLAASDVAASSIANATANTTNRGAGAWPQAETGPVFAAALNDLVDRLLLIAWRALMLLAGLLLTLAAVWGSFEAGWLNQQWLHATLYSVAALFLGAAGLWVRYRVAAARRRAALVASGYSQSDAPGAATQAILETAATPLDGLASPPPDAHALASNGIAGAAHAGTSSAPSPVVAPASVVTPGAGTGAGAMSRAARESGAPQGKRTPREASYE